MLDTKHTPLTHPPTQELEEFIDNVPGWLLRSGISLIALVVMSLIFISAYIRYPEKISGTGLMTSETPPIEHFAVSAGLVDEIYVKQNDQVRAGQRLLFIGNPCRIPDVAALQKFMSAFDKVVAPAGYCELYFPASLQLGEMQAEYAQLELLFVELTVKLKESDVRDQVGMLRNEILNLDKLNEVIGDQQNLSQKVLSLVERDHSRNQHLNSNNVISDSEIEKSKREVIRHQSQHTDLRNKQIENHIRKNQLALEIHRLVTGRDNIEKEYRLKLRELMSNLRQSIAKWEEKYFVTAEINGVVALSSRITENYRLSSNQLVAQVLPPTRPSGNFVRVNVSGKGIGRIRKGNRAILKIEGYPYKEYGTVTSYVTFVSILPKEDKNGNLIHELILALPDKIVTNYKKNIPYRASTEVSAEVITSDRSVLERIFNEFLDLIKNV
jgi:HlyD family secretion protein